MKSAATPKNPEVVTVPVIVRVSVIGIQPEAIVIVLDVEHVQVAVRISYI